MKERQLPFSAPMVRAVLAGSKTMTRRIAKGIALEWLGSANFTPEYVALPANGLSPYGYAGDRLWVREAWRVGKGYDGAPGSAFTSPTVWYEADGNLPLDRVGRYRHARFMPRWASRITLEVTGVRVERLQDISEADAIAEGAEPIHATECTPTERELLDLPLLDPATPYRNGFASLWESLNGAGSWNANPWVWVIGFRRIEQEATAA